MKEENIQEQSLSKKEKAEIAGNDVAEMAIRGAGRYYGGSVGGAVVDAALNTKMGQKGIGRVGKRLNRNPITKSVLARNQGNISSAKPMVNSMISGMGKGGSASSSLENDSNISDNNANGVNNKDINSFDEDNSSISGDISKNDKSKSIKTKIMIGFISSIFPIFISFLFLIIPLIALDIIDIDDIVNVGGSFTSNYSSISSSNTHWWPVGSSNTTNSNGVLYASNSPSWSKITSYYGMRLHPVHKEYIMHGGIDIADGSDYGQTNIIAVKDGTVLYPSDNDQMDCPSSSTGTHSCDSSYGNYVAIEHNDGTTTIYAHLHQNTITVRAGDVVKQGQVIGKMGSSGTSTGTHLHFEVKVNGNKVDPLSYVSMNSPRPKSFTSGTATIGNSNKQSVCLTLKNKGIPNSGVAAIMTNINAESGFRLTALGDNGTSYGLCQWHNGRYANLKSTYPDSYHTVDSQINFLMYELQNKYTNVYNSVMNANESASDLTYYFCAKFERPANTESSCKKRTNKTNLFVEYVNNGCQ